ncbi:conserved hypothetical protein [Theileria orientalis strain Shintoku]|uniref:Uncharacterized protein n=1 Tax=Theileria orientalis strain Shintoku TaxID=869250 RepID=J4C826_THEOR|nr:conserved hypothetical protein [Theileria orientalis strain Shintoku]BAM40053.1 conserved hypothetical protein [Theileria orientalis strain Shintoku]|eukprot:XP_009690354.1 conserved hypothetical protein [Theileria orientalis strain Shintoku]
MNGSKIPFKNHYDIVYYGEPDDLCHNEDKEEGRPVWNKWIGNREIFSPQYIYHITSHRSMLDDLIRKNNDTLAMFNLNEQFYSICRSMNIKKTKPIYGMLLTIIKEQVFEQFQFDELKNIIGALYYIHKVKRCSYKHTQEGVISVMKNRELKEEMFENYIETFSKVLKVDEISEEEVKHGVRKVINRVMEYLKTNENKIDFKIEDVYDLYDETEETDDKEVVEYNNYDKYKSKEYKEGGYDDFDDPYYEDSDEEGIGGFGKWYDNDEDNDEYEHNRECKRTGCSKEHYYQHNSKGYERRGEDEGRSSKVSTEEKRVSEELKRVLISKMESHYEEIMETSLKIFEIIKSNELNKEMMESGRMSRIKYRKLIIPTVVFVTASSYEVEMMGRYVAEGLNMEQGELIYSSKLVVEWLKNVLIKRYRYKIYNASLFLQVVRSLKRGEGNVCELDNYKRMCELDKDGNQESKERIKEIRLWEVICDNGRKVPKRIINERIDILLNYIVQNLNEEMKKVTLKKEGIKIWFTKKEVIQYEEVMEDVKVLYRKKKYDEFRRQIRITQNNHQLIYKLVVMNRKKIEITTMELIKIVNDNGFMEMISEVKLSKYAINKHMVNSMVLIAIRLMKIPISSRMLFLYVKRPEGSFYISMKKIMKIMVKVIESKQKCKISTMEEFLERIVKENDLEKMVVKTEELMKLVKE